MEHQHSNELHDELQESLSLEPKLIKDLRDTVTPGMCLSTQDSYTASDILLHAPFYSSA